MKCSRISISSGPRLKGKTKESSFFHAQTVQYPSIGAWGFVLYAAFGQFRCMDSLHRISPALRRSRSDSRVFPRYSQISECEASTASLPGGGQLPLFLEDTTGGSRVGRFGAATWGEQVFHWGHGRLCINTLAAVALFGTVELNKPIFYI